MSGLGVLMFLAWGLPIAQAVEPSSAIFPQGLISFAHGSDADNFVTINGVTFFSAEDLVRGRELWRTDRTRAGTRLVLDINPGQPYGNPGPLVEFRNLAYFGASDPENGCALWRSDGTAAGTRPVYSFVDQCDDLFEQGPSEFVVAGATLFMAAADARLGRELWRSDGTRAGTRLVKNINTKRFSETSANDYGSRPVALTAIGSTAIFLARDEIDGPWELWRSDGSSDGTRKLSEARIAYPGRSGFPMLGRAALFVVQEAEASDSVWLTDGTEAGTRPIVTLESQFVVHSSRGGPLMTEMENRIFFITADRSEPRSFSLWSTDGTAAGTDPVVAPLPTAGALFPESLTTSGRRLFFTLPGPPRDLNLWTSDGTAAGTKQLTDLSPDSAPGDHIDAQELTDVGGILYFAGSDPEHGCELWRSDGTEAGTHLVRDLSPSQARCPHPNDFRTLPERLTRAGQRLLFVHDGGVHGHEPFVSDGTEAGTQLPADIVPTCPGDCHSNGVVTIDDLVRGVSIILGSLQMRSCPALDQDANGRATVDELVSAVRAALSGCY